jgi:enoyl-CoA hydratase/carnithine racemase
MKGAGKNEFCAGDDVRGKYIDIDTKVLYYGIDRDHLNILDVLAQVKNQDPDALHFYKEEYDLVHYISMLKTPYIAVMNGHSRKYRR